MGVIYLITYPEEYFEDWDKRYNEALNMIDGREEKV